MLLDLKDITEPRYRGDYRLMSRRVVDELKKLPETQRFMKGIFAWLGFKTAVVAYKIYTDYVQDAKVYIKKSVL